jgi:hypothetical protein
VADGGERSAFASSHWPELVAAANAEECMNVLTLDNEKAAVVYNCRDLTKEWIK